MRSALLKICLIVFFLSAIVFVFAEDEIDDSFEAAKTISTEYFDLYFTSGTDQSLLNQRLNLPASDQMLAGMSGANDLSGNIDALYLRVCSILDMHLYSFRGKIKVCRDYNQLNAIYEGLFDKDLSNRSSFFVFSNNSIYISADSFKREILGHEIAHAIISHYFVVLPPVKVQEVLAGYVEYQLRKGD